jgi:tetratricopeptide (TPR) repeat protein
MVRLMILWLAVTCAVAPSADAQQERVPELAAAQKQLAGGDVPGAIAALEKIVTASPKSFDARLALGRALDLDGRHDAARRHLEDALTLAPDAERNSALTALGVSYAFESKPDEAARYYQRAFDAEVQAGDRAGAAGLANALARVYLESGNLQKADQWYTTGYEMARKISGLPAAEAALWEMRWHNAQGRIAARRGDRSDAARHADAVRAALDRGVSENQRVFYPYLLGYIAFYGKDYRTAIAELLKGDQQDPFVLGLIAQSYQRLGDRQRAAEFFRKVLAEPDHTINSAFSRPLARAFLR